MGKLMNHLQAQLKTDKREDAEKCIQVYEKLKEMHNGRVWSSSWEPLTRVEFSGLTKRTYSLTPIGELLLAGINSSSQ